MLKEYWAQFFKYDHLPATLQESSKPFCELAKLIWETFPQNAESSEALRKLLEAKDCGVRAHLFKRPPGHVAETV